MEWGLYDGGRARIEKAITSIKDAADFTNDLLLLQLPLRSTPLYPPKVEVSSGLHVLLLSPACVRRGAAGQL
jgi:hypothetical protein